MSVQRETSWSSNGSYFKYNPEAVESYFGFDFPSSEWVDDSSSVVMDVKQCRNGQIQYEGSIKFFIRRPCHYGNIGRKDPYESRAAGDWNDGDVLVKITEDCCASPNSSPSSSPSATSINHVRKVKIQHDTCSSEILEFKEVVVYDLSGNNQALNKPATQSSTLSNYMASNAVDGNYDANNFSHTLEDGGKLGWLMMCFVHCIDLLFAHFSL